MDLRTSVSALATALAPALALVLGAPALAQQGSVQDFKLPPAPTPTRDPDVQGPVDPDAPVRTTPRAIGTPTPTPSSQPSAVPSQPPLALPTPGPSPAPSRTAQQPRTDRVSAPLAAPTPRASQASAGAAVAAEAATRPESGSEAVQIAPPVPDTQSAPMLPSAMEDQAQADGGLGLIGWLGALIALLGAIGAGAWFFRRRQLAAPVPAVERPLARAPSPPPAPAASPRDAVPPVRSAAPRGPASPAPIALALGAQPVRFSRSVMNATFSYKVVLENRSTERWEDLALEADLVTAHGKAPIAEQIADPAVPLAAAKAAPALEPGESLELAGDVRLPLHQVRAIPQGRTAVYVPLLRVRLTAKGREAIARTYLIGQLPDRQGGRLRPFLLDDTPQSYPAIGLQALD